jgi:3-hydroxyacyl-CoA dehydrogenase
MEIRRAAVVGAGTMGSQIAGQIANAGVPVLLLDRVAEEGRRSALAERAVARLRRADPPPLMSRAAAGLIEPGNLEDDSGRLAEADWIVEAVVEDLAVKRAVLAAIDAARTPGSIVSSNTSALPLAALLEAAPDGLRGDLVVTHFFNPPRFLRLVELVAGPQTDPGRLAALVGFADRRLGKGVVRAKDTPGFVANRIGAFWIQTAVNRAFETGLRIEDADAALGRPAGFPKTGVFGLLDLVGLDLIPQIAGSLLERLPPDDPFRTEFREHDLVVRMIAEGFTGRKGRGGFYRLERSGGEKRKLALDLATGEVRPSEKRKLAAISAAKKGGLKALVRHREPAGQYAWAVLSATLAYAAGLVPEIADDPAEVDRAMRLGYNWERGPFEMIDRLGAAWFAERLDAESRPVPPPLAAAAEAGGFYRTREGRLESFRPGGGYGAVRRPEGVLLLEDVKRARPKPLAKTGSAALWDVGDGVTCLEFTSKMNSLDGDILALLSKAVALTAERHKALVIYNEGENFSAGANLGLVLFAANIALWGRVRKGLTAGQDAFRALRTAPVPVVGAPSGMALGGACELLMHCTAVQAHAESYIGLVEPAAGVIPAWGGCTALLHRHAAAPDTPRGPMPPAIRAFETISQAKVARSAAEAMELKFLRPTDRITMNRDRLLADAKAFALELAEDYRPSAPPAPIRLPGPSGRVALNLGAETAGTLGRATAYDLEICDALAGVLSGGDTDLTEPVDETALLALERDAFMTLVRRPKTLARMEALLNTGKPLRN